MIFIVMTIIPLFIKIGKKLNFVEFHDHKSKVMDGWVSMLPYGLLTTKNKLLKLYIYCWIRKIHILLPRLQRIKVYIIWGYFCQHLCTNQISVFINCTLEQRFPKFLYQGALQKDLVNRFTFLKQKDKKTFFMTVPEWFNTMKHQ